MQCGAIRHTACSIKPLVNHPERYLTRNTLFRYSVECNRRHRKEKRISCTYCILPIIQNRINLKGWFGSWAIYAGGEDPPPRWTTMTRPLARFHLVWSSVTWYTTIRNSSKDAVPWLASYKDVWRAVAAIAGGSACARQRCTDRALNGCDETNTCCWR